MSECTRCGACCVCSGPNAYYRVMLCPPDVARLPEDKRNWVKNIPLPELNVSGVRPEQCLDTKVNPEGLTVCIAHEGVIGEQTSCLLQETQPGVCVRYPGKMNCKFYRKKAGLHV